MEEALKPAGWLVGKAYSIADIAAAPVRQADRRGDRAASKSARKETSPRQLIGGLKYRRGRPYAAAPNFGPFDQFLDEPSRTRLKAAPMLDVPNNTEKSYADGKILQSVSDGVGVITFNNPEKRNAMSLDMWEGLGSALIELRDNPDVRVVILVGAGDKAFVSGADISQFEKTRHNAAASEEYSRKQRSAARAAGELSEADHRLHPRLLPRRRHAGGDGWPTSASPPTTASSAFPPPNSASPMAMTA